MAKLIDFGTKRVWKQVGSFCTSSILAVSGFASFSCVAFAREKTSFHERDYTNILSVLAQSPEGASEESEVQEPRVLISEVAVEGQGLNSELETLIYNTIRTKAGYTTTHSQLQEDVNNIFATGFFANVQQTPLDTPLGVKVIFMVETNPIWTETIVRSLPSNSSSILPPEVIDSIFQNRYGKIINLKDLQDSIKAIAKWYLENGYDLAQIIDAPQISADGRVTLIAAEGVIEDIQVRFFKSTDSDNLEQEQKTIPVQGRTPITEILSQIRIKKGDVFQITQAQNALQYLYSLGIARDIVPSFSRGQNPSMVVVNFDFIDELTEYEQKIWIAIEEKDRNPKRSIEAYQEVLRWTRTNQWRDQEALTLNNLANVYQSSEQFNLALKTYLEALPIFQELESPLLEFITLINIAQSYHSLQDPDTALKNYYQAINILHQLETITEAEKLFGKIPTNPDDIKEVHKILNKLRGVSVLKLLLALDLAGSYAVLGDYQQALYTISHSRLRSRAQNLEAEWDEIAQNQLDNTLDSTSDRLSDSYSEKVENLDLSQLISALGTIFANTPDIFQFLMLRFTYADLGENDKAEINKEKAYEITLKVLEDLRKKLVTENTDSNTKKLIFDLLVEGLDMMITGNEKSEEERERQMQKILSSIETMIEESDASSSIPYIRTFAPIFIRLLSGTANQENQLEFVNQILEFWNSKAAILMKEVSLAQAMLLQLQGNAYMNLLRYDEALASYQKAIDVIDQNPESTDKLFVLLENKGVFEQMENHEMFSELLLSNPELKILLDLLSSSGKLFDIVIKINSFQSVGETYIKLGELEKARDSYLKTLTLKSIVQKIMEEKLGTQSEEGLDHAQIYYGLAHIEKGLGNPIAAKKYMEQALKLLENYASQRRNLFGGSGFASANYSHGYGLRDGGMSIGVGFSAKGILGRIANDPSDAFGFFNSTSCTTPTEYSICKQKYFSFYIDLLMELHQQNPTERYDILAFEASERSRSRTFSIFSVIRESELDEAKGGEEDSFNQLYKKRIELNKPVKYEAIRNLLDRDTVLLEYFLGEEKSYLWVLSQNNLEVYNLPPRQEIEELARSYRELIISDPTAYKETATIGRKLSQAILGQAMTHLGNKRLVIVGDGVLQYLPFSALPDLRFEGIDTSAKGEFARYMQPLLLRHEIANLPSASMLVKMRENRPTRPVPTKELAIFADPVLHHRDERANVIPRLARISIANTPYVGSQLTGTQEEGTRIAQLVSPEQRGQYFGFAANYDTALSAEMSQYRIIHFGTHGIFNTHAPERSGISLSTLNERGELQRGLLSPFSTLTMNLSAADLVVLSACRTGLSSELRREALTGLVGGLMSSGAERVVTSLWVVKDAQTIDLMGPFYKNILGDRASLTPAQSLRKAQLAMWNEPTLQAPLYWAAFVLHGEWD